MKKLRNKIYLNYFLILLKKPKVSLEFLFILQCRVWEWTCLMEVNWDILLIDTETTYSSIWHELYSVSRLAKTNDRILIYFSEHGQIVIAVESDMQIGYIIPVNGDINEPTLTGIPNGSYLQNLSI